MNYLALLFLLLAVMLQGQLQARWERVRCHPVFGRWFFSWACPDWCSACRRHDRETPADLWLGRRIAPTLRPAVSLSRLEAAAAVKGLAVAFALALVQLADCFASLIPDADALRHLIHPRPLRPLLHPFCSPCWRHRPGWWL